VSAQRVIQTCIDRSRKAKDGRGSAQAARLCWLTLAADGDLRIALDVADAARRIGEWLRTWNATP
jgi:hypothetical protein